MSSQVRNEQIQMLSKTILMNETNSKTTKLGHVVEIGVCRERDAESWAHFPNRAYADL